MQKLFYEAAWDRTISEKDRDLIENAFQHTRVSEGSIQFTPLRWDINHRNELLLIVLVHNSTNEDFSFNKQVLRYRNENVVLAENCFTFPRLTIAAKTSMPWTFIFPAGNYLENVEYGAGTLEMVD